MSKYNLEYGKERIKLKQYNFMNNSYPKHSFTEYINDRNKHLCSDDAIDLLTKMLIVDPVSKIDILIVR